MRLAVLLSQFSVKLAFLQTIGLRGARGFPLFFCLSFLGIARPSAPFLQYTVGAVPLCPPYPVPALSRAPLSATPESCLNNRPMGEQQGATKPGQPQGVTPIRRIAIVSIPAQRDQLRGSRLGSHL